MEYHLFFIVRMLCYFAAVILGVVFLIRMRDRPMARRIAAGVSATAVAFNQKLAEIVYSLLASVLEAILGVVSVGFVLALALVLMLLPIILVIGWLKSK